MDDIRYQAFISYARDNNLASSLPGPDGSCRGWVQVLHDELTRALIGNLSRRLRRNQRDGLLWIDYEQLRGGEQLAPEIAAKLQASRLFVPVLSPAWFDSDWCLRELELFVEAQGDGPNRLFPVWHSPVDEAMLDGDRARAAHRRLRAVTDFRFWAADAEHQPCTLWDPIPDPTERQYLQVLKRLARQMSARIAEIAAGEGEVVIDDNDPLEPPSAAAPAGPEPAADDPAPAPLAGRHLVLVNGGIDDAEPILALAEHLRQSHPGLGTAVPLHTQPQLARDCKPSALRRDLRTKLERSTAVLFFYRQGPPDQLDQQIDACTQAAVEPRDDGSTLTLDLCHCGDQPLMYVPPELAVHRSDDQAHCGEHFIDLLRARATAPKQP